MEDIIDIIVTETTNTIEITAQPNDEIIDVNIIDNREDITLNVTPSVVEININSLTSNFGVEWGDITGTLSDQEDLQDALDLKADLVDGKVPSSQLPSYVDDVVEVANFASLPVTGETGKIYITLDTNFIYRWTGSTYVEIKDSSAVWGAITGTLSNQTDLQNALNAKQNQLNGTGFVKASGTTISYDNSTYLTTSSAAATYVPYTGATSNVNLGVNDITAGSFTGGTASFATSGAGAAVGINHSSGAGIALNISKAGNGEGIYVNKTSGTGNAVTIVGTLNATTLVKNGGTSSQFLKADGSVDSSTYLTTGTASSTYLPLGGGTLTGALFATSASFSGFVGFGGNTSPLAAIDVTGAGIFSSSVRSSGYYLTGMTSGSGALYYSSGANRVTVANYNTNGIVLFEVNGGSTALTLNANLSATFAGAISGTSASFSSSVTANNLVIRNSGVPAAQFFRDLDVVSVGSAGQGIEFGARSGSTYIAGAAIYGGLDNPATTGNLVFQTLNGGSLGTRLTIANTGAATFSSSVSATSIRSSAVGTFAFNTANNGEFQIYATSADGMIMAGRGSNNDMVITNKNGADVFRIPTGTTTANFAGNVGIGTTSPNAVLEVAGTSATSDFRISRTVSSSTYFFIKAPGGSPSASSMGVNGTDVMTLNASGNVGIGTTAPTGTYGRLSVAGGISILNDNNAKFEIGRYSSGASNSYIKLGANSDSLRITNNTDLADLFTITNAGSVGIGTTSPSQPLEIGGTGNILVAGGGTIFSGAGALFVRAGSGGDLILGANNTNGFARITSGGDLLIGTTTNVGQRMRIDWAGGAGKWGIKMDASDGGAANLIEFLTGGNVRGSITTNGTSVAYNTTSDYRLKEDLKPIKGLEIVNKIKVYDYEWKSNGSRMDGVLAHELAEVLPYAVSGIKDGAEMQSVDYSKIVPVMVQAIKDLKQELDTLKNK